MAAPKTGNAEARVVITMYDVGFGDCFLVRFPGGDGERRILFDCGSIKAGSAPMAAAAPLWYC